MGNCNLHQNVRVGASTEYPPFCKPKPVIDDEVRRLVKTSWSLCTTTGAKVDAAATTPLVAFYDTFFGKLNVLSSVLYTVCSVGEISENLLQSANKFSNRTRVLSRFIACILLAAEVSDEATIVAHAEQLAIKNNSIGFKAEHYTAFSSCLITSLKECSGDVFTDNVQDAWLNILSKLMLTIIPIAVVGTRATDHWWLKKRRMYQRKGVLPVEGSKSSGVLSTKLREVRSQPSSARTMSRTSMDFKSKELETIVPGLSARSTHMRSSFTPDNLISPMLFQPRGSPGSRSRRVGEDGRMMLRGSTASRIHVEPSSTTQHELRSTASMVHIDPSFTNQHERSTLRSSINNFLDTTSLTNTRTSSRTAIAPLTLDNATMGDDPALISTECNRSAFDRTFDDTPPERVRNERSPMLRCRKERNVLSSKNSSDRLFPSLESSTDDRSPLDKSPSQRKERVLPDLARPSSSNDGDDHASNSPLLRQNESLLASSERTPARSERFPRISDTTLLSFDSARKALYRSPPSRSINLTSLRGNADRSPRHDASMDVWRAGDKGSVGKFELLSLTDDTRASLLHLSSSERPPTGLEGGSRVSEKYGSVRLASIGRPRVSAGDSPPLRDNTLPRARNGGEGSPSINESVLTSATPPRREKSPVAGSELSASSLADDTRQALLLASADGLTGKDGVMGRDGVGSDAPKEGRRKYR